MFTERYLFEYWRPVPGYEGFYEVSNFGRVKSLDRVITYPHYKRKSETISRPIKGQLLNLEKSNNGYLRVSLKTPEKQDRFLAHRLVCIVFLPNPLNLPQVNHKNELDKTDNFVWVNPDGTVDPEKSSLEWSSAVDNHHYGTAHNRTGNNHKKQVSQYTKNGTLVRTLKGAIDFKKYGFDNKKISNVCRGLASTHKGYIFKFS